MNPPPPPQKKKKISTFCTSFGRGGRAQSFLRECAHTYYTYIHIYIYYMYMALTWIRNPFCNWVPNPSHLDAHGLLGLGAGLRCLDTNTKCIFGVICVLIKCDSVFFQRSTFLRQKHYAKTLKIEMLEQTLLVQSIGVKPPNIIKIPTPRKSLNIFIKKGFENSELKILECSIMAFK